MSEHTTLESLNSIKYLYLRHLSEPSDNSLQIVVQEAVVNRSGSVRPVLPELSEILKGARPIESTEGCRTFELYWKRYAAYLVTEELLGSNAGGGYGDEVYKGSLIRVYSKSHFLDHLVRDTGGHMDPILHYKLICLNHLIDVACYTPPEIRQISVAPRSSPAQ